MFMRRFGWMIITGVALAVALICAITQFQSRPKLGKLSELAFFKGMSAQELMSDDEFKYYMRAQENLDCELASILLNTAFIRQYPQFEPARLKRQCAGDDGCFQWKLSVGIIFVEQGYCQAVSEYNEADHEIRIRELSAPIFNEDFLAEGVQYDEYWVQIRDYQIGLLINFAQSDYIPALLKIGGMLRNDGVFMESTEAEYYVLSRVCFLKSESCAKLAKRMAELKGALSSERAALVELKASDEPSLEPIFLADILLAGKV